MTRRERALDGANPILGVLNGDGDTEAQERLTAILHDIQTLDSMCAGLRRHERQKVVRLGDRDVSFPDYPTEEGQQAHRDVYELSVPILARVNRQLSKSRWSHRLMIHNGTKLLRIWDFHERPGAYNLEFAINYLLNSSLPSGEISKFRNCAECGKWLFAVTEHQRYCSKKCRVHHIAHSERFKEKRRNYMKKYRNDQEQFELAAKRLIGKSKGR